MTIQPLGNRVLVELKKKETATASGIVLPETGDKQKAEGVVVAVGPGKMLENGNRAKMEVQVGQTVLLKSWGGDEVKLNDKEYKIFDAEDILAIVE